MGEYYSEMSKIALWVCSLVAFYKAQVIVVSLCALSFCLGRRAEKIFPATRSMFRTVYLFFVATVRMYGSEILAILGLFVVVMPGIFQIYIYVVEPSSFNPLVGLSGLAVIIVIFFLWFIFVSIVEGYRSIKKALGNIVKSMKEIEQELDKRSGKGK